MEKLKVSTFNIQNSNSPTSNKWERRMDAACEFITIEDLDIIGTQELTPNAKNYLEKNLKNYHIIGDTRGSIGITDEYNSILLKKDLFDIMEFETYALSNTIYTKGTKFFGDSFPRICTMGKLKTKNNLYLVLNTHLDNVPGKHRKKELEVLSEIIDINKENDIQIILTGDFNMRLKDKSLLEKFRLENNFKDAVLTTSGSSFRNFNQKLPIDHIFYSDGLEMVNSKMIDKQYSGVYPSDHFPMVTTLKHK